MARRFLPAGASGIALARILRALFPGCGSRFDVLRAAGRAGRAAMDGSDTGQFSFFVQTSPRNYSCMSPPRLQCGIERISPRHRAAGTKITGDPDSAAAFILAQRWPATAAQVSYSIT